MFDFGGFKTRLFEKAFENLEIPKQKSFVFAGEMGDKTQLATIALGAHYSSLVLVTLGITAGMIASNALAVFLGDRLLKRIPVQRVRRFASILFVVFGFRILVGF